VFAAHDWFCQPALLNLFSISCSNHQGKSLRRWLLAAGT
jgi:hypothetical protein